MTPTIDSTSLWPLVVYFFAVLVVVGGMVGISYILGQRHADRATGRPYESGIAPTGTARLRFDVKFYLVAMIFVIFDLEAAFIFAWAVAVRDVGWTGYFGLLVFVGVLVAALIYEWRMGALDWHSGRWDTRRQPEGTPSSMDGKEDAGYALAVEQTEYFTPGERQ